MTNSTSPKSFMRRKRVWLILAALLILLVALAAIFVFLLDRGPKTTRTDFPDYEAVAARFPRIQPLRYPTDKELRRFPLTWPTRPPEENAIMDYLDAIEAYSSKPEPAGSYGSTEPYDGDATAFGARIEANRTSLDTLRLASEREYFALPAFMNQTDEMPLATVDFFRKMRMLSGLCCDAGLNAELRGEPDEAAQSYMTCLRMGRHMQRGIIIQSLTSKAIISKGADPLSHLIENASLKNETLKEIISLCELEPPVAQEIAFVLDAEDEWFDAHPMLMKGVHRIRTDHDRAVRNARENFMVPLDTLLQDEEARGKLEGGASNLSIDAALWRWRRELAMRQVRLQALKARAAIALYRNRIGQLPEKLEELVPDVLKQVPLDPYTGRPFQYKQDGNTWQLRSAGPDAAFDAHEPDHPQLRGHFWEHTRQQKGLGSDFIFVSTLDSNVNTRKWQCPKADAAWAKLHPEWTKPMSERPGPDQPPVPEDLPKE